MPMSMKNRVELTSPIYQSLYTLGEAGIVDLKPELIHPAPAENVQKLQPITTKGWTVHGGRTQDYWLVTVDKCTIHGGRIGLKYSVRLQLGQIYTLENPLTDKGDRLNT